MKKFIFILVLMTASACLASGVGVLAELAFRAFGFVPDRGALIDAALFPFAPYTVSSHPPNTKLGLGKSLLDGYFGEDECVADDGVAARFNSLGFRGPEFPPPGSKQPGVVRVLISGGSASISWNVGEKCTLDAQLGQRLGTLLPGWKVEIFNLGNGAWKSFQELVAMELHGLDLQPDVVVHFSGFNDVFHAFSMPINMAYSTGMMDLAFQRYVAWLKGSPREFLGEFRIGSAIKSLFRRQPMVLDRPGAPPASLPEYAQAAKPGSLGTRTTLPLDLDAIARRTDFDPYNREVVNNYLKNERLMARAVATTGATLISVLQPTLYLKQPLDDAEDRMMKSGYAPTVNFTVQGYLRLRLDLAALSTLEPNVQFVDLSTAFNGSQVQFGDNVHFNKVGYRVVAKQLAPVIAAAINAKEP